MYRYQKIHTHIWHKGKFPEFTDDTKLLYFYFLTSPHSNSIGLYVLPKLYIQSDMKWSLKRLHKPFEELLALQFIQYDKTTGLVIVRNHLKHNEFKNSNQVKGAMKILETLPLSKIFLKTKIIGLQFYSKLMKPFRELLGEQLRQLFIKQSRTSESRRQKAEDRKQKTEEKKTGSISQFQYNSFLEDNDFLATQAKQLKKSIEQVKEKIVLIQDACLSKGRKYYDLPATLRNWFKNDFGFDSKPSPLPQSKPIEKQPKRTKEDIETAKKSFAKLKNLKLKFLLKGEQG